MLARASILLPLTFLSPPVLPPEPEPISVSASETSEAIQISQASEPSETIEVSGDQGRIAGVVTHTQTRAALESVQVTLRCDCLAAPRTTNTNARGIYMFTDLPPGEYSVEVVAGPTTVTKVTRLPRSAKFRANFSVDPEHAPEEIVVSSTPISTEPTALPLTPAPLPVSEIESVCEHEWTPTSFPEVLPLDRHDKRHPGFRLQRSLINDGGSRELLGGPRVHFSIM